MELYEITTGEHDDYDYRILGHHKEYKNEDIVRIITKIVKKRKIDYTFDVDLSIIEKDMIDDYGFVIYEHPTINIGWNDIK